MRHECSVRVEDLGPSLLGQLSWEESEALEAAVARCPSCSADVERLRPVVSALAGGTGGVERDVEAEPRPVPDLLLSRVLASVHDEESAARRRRWVTVSSTAALAAIVLGLLLAVVMRTTTQPRESLALSGSTSASGHAIVSSQDWGTAITLDVHGLVPGTAYGAWLADGTGKRVPAGTFRPQSDGTVRLDLGASMTLDVAAQVGVTALGGGGDVLTAAIPAEVTSR